MLHYLATINDLKVEHVVEGHDNVAILDESKGVSFYQMKSGKLT